ncbi:hypothetical protein ACFSWE_11740 [Leucobacter albus]|uniref:Uncharacterized protein n=1 Tax=Leucobacter albus TaxID=272210 RepID=A0ABW3TQ74_9MICO
MRFLSVLVGASVLGLAGCSAPEPEPEPEELTVTEAGARYLDAVCPVNEAWDEVDAGVDRLRVAGARPAQADAAELSEALGAELSAALTRLEQRSLAAVKTLDDPLVAWPAAAQAAVEEVRDTLVDDAEQASSAAALDGQELSEYRWKDPQGIAEAAARARAALGLPEDPAAACDAR